MAELIKSMMPSIEMVRMVNSGTEATMSAIRLARAFTGREKIIKFEGCYHGHADSFLIKAGSGALTLGVPDSPGVPPSVAGDTLSARYNDLNSVEKQIKAFQRKIAAVIVEPVVGNFGCVPPKDGFLQKLSDLCKENSIILIFDEVMTGFRLSRGGAQELYGVKPDLTTLGKIIGGGLPVGAYGGRAKIMQLVAPSGPVYQAGTLSGNPLAMAAGIKTLIILRDSRSFYRELEEKSARLQAGIQEIIDRHDFPVTQNRVGSMFTLFFTPNPVVDYEAAKCSDRAQFATYFQNMLTRGIFLPPSQFEAAFVSAAHTELDIDATLRHAEESLFQVFDR
jgi:glutamate-1-semialdehyde 2,1-aminomutase